MASRFVKAIDNFLDTTKKGYDETYWIFVIIFGAGIVTALFGIAGTAAVLVIFIFFYFMGRISIRREKRRAEERKNEKRRGSR